MMRALRILGLIGLLLLAPWIAHAGDALGIAVGSPLPMAGAGTVPAFTTFVMDSTTDQTEWVFQMPEAATLTQGCFLYGVRLLTPPTYSIALQGVGTDGNPNGTDVGGGSPTLVTFTPPADTSWDNLGQCRTFTNAIAVTRGQMLSQVIAYSSGTVSGATNSSFVTDVSQLQPQGGPPYRIQNNAGSRARTNNLPVFWVKSSTKTYGRPMQSINATVYASDSTPDERASACTFPTGWGNTFTVRGVRAVVDMPAAGKTVLVTLYSGTTALQTVTLDSDATSSTVRNPGVLTMFFDEATLTTLSFGTLYRIGFAPQETSADFGLYQLTMAAAGDLTAHPMRGACYLSTRTDAGAWTDDTATVPEVEWILEDITRPSAGGLIGG